MAALAVAAAASIGSAQAQQSGNTDILIRSAPRPVFPGFISTADASEMRLAVSPDGRRMLWAAKGRADGDGTWDIYESALTGSGWSTPRPVPFNGPGDDTGPVFAVNGLAVLFSSDRAGGMGGADLWSVPFSPRRGLWGKPVNLGPQINSPGNETAPDISRNGLRLLFTSDGTDTGATTDLLIAQPVGTGWGEALPLPGINTEGVERDGVFLADGLSIVYAASDGAEGPLRLHLAVPDGLTGYHPAGPLPDIANCSDSFNAAPGTSRTEPNLLYVTADCPDIGPGGLDIFRIEYQLIR